MKRILTATIFLLLSMTIAKAETNPAPNITYLIKGVGGRLDWCDANHLLVFDKNNADHYARIWTMDIDGKNQKCLTCNSTLLPDRHQGNPAWHPSGEFIVLQVADPASAGIFSGSALYKLATSPGAGAQNNIWIINKDGSQAWQITHLDRKGGVLHPHFSPDGTKLIWAEMIGGKLGIGNWVIKIADFSSPGGVPQVSNVQTLTPGNLQWYETHGFSPDGSTLIFSGMKPGGAERDFDIYTYNLNTKDLKLLTDPKLQQWDEHAHFLPDGKSIIWMSSMDNGQRPKDITTFGVKTDYWIMDADGGNQKRLTHFNNPQAKFRTIASDLSISGDGKYLFGYIQDPGGMDTPGSIVRIDLK